MPPAFASRKDRLRSFEIAYGSFRESQVILKLEGVKSPELLKISDQLGASPISSREHLWRANKNDYLSNKISTLRILEFINTVIYYFCSFISFWGLS